MFSILPWLGTQPSRSNFTALLNVCHLSVGKIPEKSVGYSPHLASLNSAAVRSINGIATIIRLMKTGRVESPPTDFRLCLSLFGPKNVPSIT